MIKGIFYLFSLLISIWALDSININGIFKKNRYYQSRILYFLIAIFLSCTTTNFFYDFFVNTKIL